MLEVASQIIICLILAALLGWIIGYLMGNANCKNKKKCHKEPNNTHELHVDNKETIIITPSAVNEKKPLLLSEARAEGKDNLQLIKGVGTVLEKVLNETGIYHFDQIAQLSTEEVNWLDSSISFPGRIKREQWVAQAKALAIHSKKPD